MIPDCNKCMDRGCCIGLRPELMVLEAKDTSFSDVLFPLLKLGDVRRVKYLKVCPHLEFPGGRCRIYDDRPLICKLWPILPGKDDNHLVVDIRCPDSIKLCYGLVIDDEESCRVFGEALNLILQAPKDIIEALRKETRTWPVQLCISRKKLLEKGDE